MAGVAITQVGKRFRARVEIGKKADGSRDFDYAYFGTRREALAFRDLVEEGLGFEEAKAQVLGTAQAAPKRKGPASSCPTLREWTEKYLDQAGALGTIRPQSVRQYRISVTKHFLPLLGDVPLDELTREKITDAIAKVARNSPHASTKHNLRARLSAVLAGAVPTLIPYNPASGIKLGKQKTSAGQIMTPDQRKRLLDLARPDPVIGPVIRFAVTTGTRRGEIAGLVWRYVDLAAGKVQIEFQALDVRDGSRVGIQSLKTEGSRRTVSLPPAIVEELRAMRAAAELDAKARGRDVGDLPVFPDQVGKTWRPSSLGARIKRVMSRAGLDGYTLHDLRHCHASALLADRQNPKAVSRRLGHADIKTTLAIYSHLLPQDDEQLTHTAANLLEA